MSKRRVRDGALIEPANQLATVMNGQIDRVKHVLGRR